MSEGAKAQHAVGMEKVRAHLAMLLFATLISGSFSLGHLAAPSIDPFALTVARFMLATCVMGVLGIVVYGRLPVIRQKPWRFIVLGGLMATYFVLMFVALQIASPVTTGAVFTLVPLMSAIFGWILLGQKSAAVVVLSLLIGAAGAIWVIFKGDLDAIVRLEIGKGELIFFFGCAAHALFAPMVRKLNHGEAVFGFTFMTVIGSTVCMLAVGSTAAWETNWTELPAIVWVTIVYLAVFTTAGTFFLLQYASLRLPASKVMAYGYLIPGIIVLYEWFLGHGFVSTSLLLGVLVIAMVLVILAAAPD